MLPHLLFSILFGLGLAGLLILSGLPILTAFFAYSLGGTMALIASSALHAKVHV